MTRLLDGKVALVTGGGRGVGAWQSSSLFATAWRKALRWGTGSA